MSCDNTFCPHPHRLEYNFAKLTNHKNEHLLVVIVEVMFTYCLATYAIKYIMYMHI